MEWNMPFANPVLNCSPQNVHSMARQYPQVIGEGEITSIIFPDGSMQLYFVPTIRHDWTTCQCNTNVGNNNFLKPANAECWFIRSATWPSAAAFNTRLPNLQGDRLMKQSFNPNYCMNMPNYPDYYQKFHSDNTTSTTDILYFYPHLCQSTKPQLTPIANQNLYEGVCKKLCNCKVNFNIKDTEPSNCRCKESASIMSIDGENSILRHSSKNKKYKRCRNDCEQRDHICGCRSKELKDKSGEIVTTYVFQTSGGVAINGRETQTTKNKNRSDVKTNVWVSLKGNDRKKSNLSVNTECASCCSTDNCTDN